MSLKNINEIVKKTVLLVITIITLWQIVHWGHKMYGS